MIKLTIIVNGLRLVRMLTPEQATRAAEALERQRPMLNKCALTVLFEGADKITHILCRRPAPMEN